MNTTDAMNASLSLLHENTSQTHRDTNEDGFHKFILVFVAVVAIYIALVVITSARIVVRMRYKDRATWRIKRNIKAHATIDKDTGEDDTPFLDFAGTDENSRKSIQSGYGSGSVFDFDDDVQTEMGYPNRNVFISNHECRIPIVIEQCHNSSFESVLFDESNLILNDQPIHATERFGDGCSDSNWHNKAPYEECIEYMKHVKSPAGEDGEDPDETCPKTVEQTEPKDIDYNLLDWNRVFEYLAERIEASKWIRFFNTLYGNSPCELKVDVSVKLDQVEHDFKERAGRGDTVSHLIHQFKAWKQFTGRNAKHTMIEKTLEDLQWNDKLDVFRTYMRNPPLLSSDYDQSQNELMLDTSFKGSLPSVISLPFLSGTGIENAMNDQRNIQHSRGFQSNAELSIRCEMSYKLDSKQPNSKSVNHKRNDPDGEDSINCGRNVKEDELQTTNNTSKQSFRVKEIIDKACSSNSIKRSQLSSGNIKGKGMSYNTKRTRKKVLKHRRARKLKYSRPKLSKDSFHLLLSTFLQSAKVNLKRDMYEICLQHTFSKIVKETRDLERVILSLTCDEYHKLEKLKTTRENIYIMYSGNTRLTLGEEAFEELRCFTENVRQQVIDRLAENIDKESQKYIFIDFDGKRIHLKETKPELADDTSLDGSSYITIEDDSAMSVDDDP